MKAIPAPTSDGKQCSACFGAVKYDRLSGLHYHTQIAPDCATGGEWAAAIEARGEGYLLEDAWERLQEQAT